MDAVTVKVAARVYRDAERAYDYPRPIVTPFDPELCHQCQNVNSVRGNLCERCNA